MYSADSLPHSWGRPATSSVTILTELSQVLRRSLAEPLRFLLPLRCQCHYRPITQLAVTSQFLTLRACNQYVQIYRTMTPSLFCDVMQSRLVISCRRFEITYRSPVKKSKLWRRSNMQTTALLFRNDSYHRPEIGFPEWFGSWFF
jgi:hypothetical protein